MLIRGEDASDEVAISQVITDAMRRLAQATGTEASIVDALRAADALILSLVAVERGKIIGYLAASPAQIGEDMDWVLIGPVAVQPERHRQGIGSRLMAEALRRLRTTASGTALVGDPAYYSRFGFRAYPGLTVAGCPPEVVQALPFKDGAPCGEIIHHAAFGLSQNA